MTEGPEEPPPSAPEGQVILEKIESQNRLTIEAVETNRVVLEDRIQAVATDLGGRLTNVETAVASLVDRADGTDRRLGGIDTRLDGIDGRLDRLEARMEGREQVIDRRLDLITAALDRIESESRVDADGGPVPAGGAGRRPGEANRLTGAQPAGRFDGVAPARHA